MTSTDGSPLERRIRAVLDAHPIAKHRLVEEWTDGRLSMERMREVARQYYHFEAAFPRYLSAIHARTKSEHIRQLLLENLWDEEHGERNHAALWLEFARALDLSTQEVRSSNASAQTAQLIQHFDRMAREAPLAEALATLFAFEGQVPTVAWQAIKGLTDHYGLEPRQFEFFSVHLVSDVAHSGAEMAAIEESCRDEEGVIRATEQSCERLLAFLDGCYEGPAMKKGQQKNG